MAFDETIRSRVESRSKKNHLHALLAAMSNESPAKKTSLYDILREVAENKAQKGMVVVISDFFADRESLFKGLNLLRHRGHDVLLFHVLDDQELDFNYSGTTKFDGMEEMGDIVCDPRSLREGYIEAMEAYLSELRRHCSKNVIDYQTVRTSEHLDAALAHYLNHRIGMRQTVRS